MSTFETVHFRSVRNCGTPTEMGSVVSVLRVDIDFCIIKRIELLSSDQGVSMSGWRFVPPCDQSLVLLKNVVSWSQFFLLLLASNSICDVGSKYVPVQRDEQLPWVVCVVI